MKRGYRFHWSGALLVALSALFAVPAAAQSAKEEAIAAARASAQHSASTLSAGAAQGQTQGTEEDTAAWTSQTHTGPAAAKTGGAALRDSCEGSSSAQCQALQLGAQHRNQTLDADTAAEVSKLRSGELENPLTAIEGTYSDCETEHNPVGISVRESQFCYDYYLRALDLQCDKTLEVDVQWGYSCAWGDAGPFPEDGADWSNPPVPHYCKHTTEHTEWTCPEGTFKVGGTCLGSDGIGVPATAHTEEVINRYSATATPIETDHWNNPCANWEGRVPPGMLPKDGDNDVGPPIGPGPKNKCERIDSTCIVPKETRLIKNHAVTRECWKFRNTFNCLEADEKSDCGGGMKGTCTPVVVDECIETDELSATSFSGSSPTPTCVTWRSEYNCETRNTERIEDVVNCGSQTYTSSSGTWDTGYTPDRDFAQTMAFMEAGKEAAKYLNVDDLQIFKGFDNRCHKKLFGLENCCARNESDGIFGANCSDAEKELRVKRDAELCYPMGSYCSKKLKFIGTCQVRTQTYCCFHSLLARLLNIQGKEQLGISLGSAKYPNCAGFTPEELQKLDFAKMDLTQFMDSIKAKSVNLDDLIQNSNFLQSTP